MRCRQEAVVWWSKKIATKLSGNLYDDWVDQFEGYRHGYWDFYGSNQRAWMKVSKDWLQCGEWNKHRASAANYSFFWCERLIDPRVPPDPYHGTLHPTKIMLTMTIDSWHGLSGGWSSCEHDVSFHNWRLVLSWISAQVSAVGRATRLLRRVRLHIQAAQSPQMEIQWNHFSSRLISCKRLHFAPMWPRINKPLSFIPTTVKGNSFTGNLARFTGYSILDNEKWEKQE